MSGRSSSAHSTSTQLSLLAPSTTTNNTAYHDCC